MKAVRDAVLNLKESPLYEYRVKNHYYPVIGEGSHDARIIFIGEAPGQKEAESARPFCGAAGRVLDELLESISLARESVYVTNIVKDRPPGNRDPNPDEIELYSPFLLEQIEIIQPKVIATLGRFSMRFILETFGFPEAGETISKLHGKKLTVDTGDGMLTVVPLYHPAVALYNSNTKNTLKEDFKVLKDVAEG